MKKNMGSADRIIRLVIALVATTLFFTDVISGYLGITLMVVSVIFFLTSLLSFCPIYAAFGLNTCGIKTGKTTE